MARFLPIVVKCVFNAFAMSLLFVSSLLFMIRFVIELFLFVLLEFNKLPNSFYISFMLWILLLKDSLKYSAYAFLITDLNLFLYNLCTVLFYSV